ncbi:hypothetical protein LJR143_002176 [Pseudoxanthomonas sp. LjRoot143]
MNDLVVRPVHTIPIEADPEGAFVVGMKERSRRIAVGGAKGLMVASEDGLLPVDKLPLNIPSRISAVEAGQAAGQLVFSTWAQLSPVVGSAGKGAQVLNDAGTHTDPVSSTTVPNAGQYAWSTTANAWQWVRADGLALKADQTSLDALELELESRVGNTGAVVFAVTDPSGFSAFEVRDDEIRAKNVSVSTEGIVFGSQRFESTEDYAFAVVDDHGFIGLMLGADGTAKLPLGDDGASAADDLVGELNTTALASSFKVANSYNAEVARPVWDFNHFIMYGQSLSTGQEGWPALSKVARYGNVMLGDCTRPLSGSAASWTSVGGSDAFKPLVAAVQDGSGAVMAPAAVAALAPGAQNLGEDPVVAFVNFAKHQHNQRWQVANDEARVFVATSCGVSGKTIEQLSSGASPDLYQRITQAATKVKAQATAASKSYGITAVAFLQGEYNYVTDFGGSTSKAAYRAALLTLYNDLEEDVVSAISGQSAPPLFITYQTGASYTRDTDALSIGMAQWELSEEKRNWVMACPVYPYTDKGGHMDPNGYRWIGAQFGKVWHRVVELGQDWKPLSPLRAVRDGLHVYVSFHVPAPPLQFGMPYVLLAETNYANKGFEVLIDGVSATIASVTIVADCVVRLSLLTMPTGALQVRYAGKTVYNGNGCLHDSDTTVADASYEYEAGTGQYASANIPALVGKPYPLHNWCIAFQIGVEG